MIWMTKSPFDTWESDRYCSCDHCKGGKNKHAWSFYYFCKRQGDKVTVKTTKDKIIMRILEYDTKL